MTLWMVREWLFWGAPSESIITYFSWDDLATAASRLSALPGSLHQPLCPPLLFETSSRIMLSDNTDTLKPLNHHQPNWKHYYLFIDKWRFLFFLFFFFIFVISGFIQEIEVFLKNYWLLVVSYRSSKLYYINRVLRFCYRGFATI